MNYTALRTPWLFLWIAAFCVAFYSYNFFDIPAATWMEYHIHQPFLNFCEILTQFGRGTYYLFALPCFFFIARYLFKSSIWSRRFGFMLMSVLLSGMACDILKCFFGRSRPNLLFNEHIFGFHFFKFYSLMWSFPSGHATTIAAFALSASIIKPKFSILFIPLAFAVAISRVCLTAHFPSDVIAGLCLGSIGTLCCYDYFHYKGWKITDNLS